MSALALNNGFLLESYRGVFIQTITEVSPFNDNSSSLAWGEIDSKLDEWMRDPASAVDDGAVPPSKMVIRAARSLIVVMRHQGVEVPDMAVADGNGGIAFEWSAGSMFKLLEVNCFGEATCSDFQNAKLTSRRMVV